MRIVREKEGNKKVCTNTDIGMYLTFDKETKTCYLSFGRNGIWEDGSAYKKIPFGAYRLAVGVARTGNTIKCIYHQTEY